MCMHSYCYVVVYNLRTALVDETCSLVRILMFSAVLDSSLSTDTGQPPHPPHWLPSCGQHIPTLGHMHKPQLV